MSDESQDAFHFLNLLQMLDICFAIALLRSEFFKRFDVWLVWFDVCDKMTDSSVGAGNAGVLLVLILSYQVTNVQESLM